MTTTKKLKWEKSESVPTVIKGDLIPCQGVTLGPLGVSRSDSGWRVCHAASGMLVQRYGGFKRKSHAKHYAELLLAVPFYRELLESVDASGKASITPEWSTLEKVREITRDYGTDSNYWKTWNPKTATKQEEQPQ